MSPKPKSHKTVLPERTFFYLGLLTGIGVMLIVLTGMYIGLLAQSGARAESERLEIADAALLKAQAALNLLSQSPGEPPSTGGPWAESLAAPAAYPLRAAGVPEPVISAESAIVFDLTTERIFYEKDAHTPRRIASLSKLMSAQVGLETLAGNQPVKITPQSLKAFGEAGDFRAGETFLAKDLLKAMLIASSNDAAMALAEQLGVNEFVNRMNQRAAALGLEATSFGNPTGLDGGENSATAFDIMRLVLASLSNDQLWGMLKQSQATIYDLTSRRPHALISTNKLLGERGVFAGKTGFTTEAKGAYTALFELAGGERLGLVVLRSDDRFGDASALIEWVKKAYQW